jgi:hypothetical protein
LAEVKDAFVDYQISDDKSFNVKAGQYKIQYSREAMSAVFDLEFADRSADFPVVRPSRSPGLSLWGQLGGEKGDAGRWAVGAFNGPNFNGAAYQEGENVANDDSGLLYNARVAWNPFGAVAYAQGDLRSEEERGKFLLAIGANALYHVDDNRRADGDSFDDSSFGLDVASLWNGWFFTRRSALALGRAAECDDRNPARHGLVTTTSISRATPRIFPTRWFRRRSSSVSVTSWSISTAPTRRRT